MEMLLGFEPSSHLCSVIYHLWNSLLARRTHCRLLGSQQVPWAHSANPFLDPHQ